MNIFFQFGSINPPAALTTVGGVDTGPAKLIQTLFTMLIAFGGVYSIINFILAGYAFLSAGSDPKKVEAAWGKIWQTFLGLTFIAGAFLLGAILGKLVFGDATIILNPSIPTVSDLP